MKDSVLRAYEKRGKGRDDDEKVSVDVSFDGTWLTRCHKSLIDIAFVMDVYSGLVLDFEVLSNFCRACASMKKKEKAAFDERYRTVHSGKCQADLSGLSGAMKAEGVVRMWQRSEGKGYRYVTFLNDGDPSSFKAVCNMNNINGPYASHSVVKEFRNVQMLMGTPLQKLKDELMEEKLTKTSEVLK